MYEAFHFSAKPYQYYHACMRQLNKVSSRQNMEISFTEQADQGVDIGVIVPHNNKLLIL